MRAKAVFSVFARKLPSGKRIYYYQCYDDKDKRQWAKSTGLNKKTEAVAYCMKLFRAGLLIPEQKMPTFEEYYSGWWNPETCNYLKWRQLQDPIMQGTIEIHQSNFSNHIKEYYAKFRLDEITPDIIEAWLLSLKDKNLKVNTINLQYRTFKLMIGEAVRKKMLKTNPCLEVKDLKGEETERVILTVEEVRKLFSHEWTKVWESPVIYKAHRLAACTGLRVGELRGLRGENIFDDYISVCGQYTRHGYSPHTKTKFNRNIVITTRIRQELDELLIANGDGYVFSEDGGQTPVTVERINRQFDRALARIGIKHEEKLKRNLSFHAWRHFLNTLLRMKDVADSKVQKVTGHLTKKMTERYTHFDTRQFTEVLDVQAELLEPKKPKKNNDKQSRSKPAKNTGAKEKATA